jgi:hypothetical protein
MYIRKTLAIANSAVVLLSAATGCAVQRGQETVGAYVDDTGYPSSISLSNSRRSLIVDACNPLTRSVR